MDNEKQPYAINVKTIHQEITRQYSSLDEIWRVVDAVKSSHMPLLPIVDEPIVVINVRDIISITISGTSAAELVEYRKAKQLKEHEARQQQYMNMTQCESLGVAQAGLIGTYGSGII